MSPSDRTQSCIPRTAISRCLLLFSLHDLCRQTRPGSPEAVPRTVPAWQGTYVAGISSVPLGLTARTMMMTVVTVPKMVRKMERVCSWLVDQK